jgi:hypothetical protein
MIEQIKHETGHVQFRVLREKRTGQHSLQLSGSTPAQTDQPEARNSKTQTPGLKRPGVNKLKNLVDRRLGPNQARFWLDWVEKPSPAIPCICGTGTLACDPIDTRVVQPPSAVCRILLR